MRDSSNGTNASDAKSTGGNKLVLAKESIRHIRVRTDVRTGFFVAIGPNGSVKMNAVCQSNGCVPDSPRRI